MVSNYDRVYQEIRKEAGVTAKTEHLAAEALVTLAMEIVDIEDQHTIRPFHNIKQRISGIIRTAATEHIERERTASEPNAEVS